MAKSTKKPILNLPLKIALTESGSNYFIKNKKQLHRFRLVDNSEYYGMALKSVSLLMLQQLIMLDYVSKIEIAMPEFTSSRQELMDLSKLILYSKLYKQFNNEVLQKVISTECVKKHNRAHPGQFFDENTTIDNFTLQSLVEKQNVQILAVSKLILEPVNQEIMQNKEYRIEEKNLYLLMVEKFLQKLSLYNWYLIIMFVKNQGFGEIINGIRAIIFDYIQKSTVAEYISLMLLELAVNFEKLSMRKEAKLMYHDVEYNDKILLDPAIRQKIIDELVRKKNFVFISWKIGGSSSAIGKKGLLQITLHNKNDEFKEVKESIETKKSADLTKKTLFDFYEELPKGEVGVDLGLYYLSYLNDACKQVNVKFDSHINQFSSSGLTVMHLNFKF